MTHETHRSDMAPEARADLMRRWFPYRVTILTATGVYKTMDAYPSAGKAKRIAREILKWSDLNHSAKKAWVHNQVSGNLLATVKVPTLRCEK